MGGIPLTRPTEDEAVKVIRRALDLGVNFIDTAYSYGDGMSEERIGKAIAGRREQVILATKGGGREKGVTLKSIEVSLKRLNTGYIDLWQFHGISTFETLEWVLERGPMEEAQNALRTGKVRHIGNE
jgi:aryl-alcohol dehydrogenase-like predicted oxidoreductase